MFHSIFIIILFNSNILAIDKAITEIMHPLETHASTFKVQSTTKERARIYKCINITCSELDGEFLIKPQHEYSAVSAHLSGFNSKHACLSHITAEI